MSPTAQLRSLLIVLVPTLAAFLTGCTYRLVESQPILEHTDATDKDRGGFVYALPMTLVSVTGTKDANQKVSYTVTPTLVPDPRARYRLKYKASGVTDDVIGITADKNGLLMTSKGDAADRSGDIVVAIAKTIAAGAGAPSATTVPRHHVETKEDYPFTSIYTIDELNVANGVRLPDGMVLRLEPKWIPRHDALVVPPCTYSVCFRIAFPVKARIAPADKPDSKGHDFAFMAVDPYQTEGIDLKSAALVARTNSLTFDSGMLTGVTINQPSTTLAIASLPLTVLKAILAVPSELLTLKIQNVQNEASLAKAQADLLLQMKAVLDAQQALQKARTDAAAGAKPTPVTGTGSSP